VAFVGAYALLDPPVIPFLEKIGYLPVSSTSGWTATPDLPEAGAGNRWPLFTLYVVTGPWIETARWLLLQYCQRGYEL